MNDSVMQGTRAFLDKESHNEGAGGSAPLIPGALVEVVIVKATDKRLVRVTTRGDAVSGAITKEWKGLTLGEAHKNLTVVCGLRQACALTAYLLKGFQPVSLQGDLLCFTLARVERFLEACSALLISVRRATYPILACVKD